MLRAKFSDLKNSDFFTFFNLREINSIKIANSTEIKEFKPGGFQDHIDLKFEIAYKNDEIKSATLLLDRDWIGNIESINFFGTDITKSFIVAVTPPDEQKSVEELAHYLFNLKGLKDVVIPCGAFVFKFEESTPKIKIILDVYKNVSVSNEFKLKNSKFIFKNVKESNKQRLLIKWYEM